MKALRPRGARQLSQPVWKADIIIAAKAVRMSPGVAVNEMHGKHMLDCERRNGPLVGVEIPMAV